MNKGGGGGEGEKWGFKILGDVCKPFWDGYFDHKSGRVFFCNLRGDKTD